MSWNLADAKNDRAHKNYLTPEIGEEMHTLLRYFKACWFFNKAVWFVLATIWDDMVAKFRYF